MKRTLKFQIDVKFVAVTLFLSALVIFMIYLFASSSVLAEDAGYVGEYIDEFAPENTTDPTTVITTAPAAANAVLPQSVQNQVHDQTLTTMEAAKVGTASDPLITLSYLQNILVPQLESSLLAKLAGSTPVTITPPVTVSPAPEQTASSGGKYEVLELTQGQTVTAKSDSIEIIVRPGSAASSVSPYSDQGIADLTDGNEILNGMATPINHILLVPRNDGRGIAITSLKAYIMVRGDYEIR